MRFQPVKSAFYLLMVASFFIGSSQAVTLTTKPHSGFDLHLVYIASGFDNCTGGNDSCNTVDGIVVDDNGAPVVGDHFERVTLGRTPAELEQHRMAAVELFSTRFGGEIIAEIDGVNTASDVITWVEANIAPFTLDPRSGYRAIAISRRIVPTRGFMVRDGGWQIVVNGRIGVFGEYSILTKFNKNADAFAKNRSDIVFHYQSRNLINFNPDPLGPTAFDCEIWLGDFDRVNPQFRGLAQGIFNPSSPSPNIRNIITLDNVNKTANPGLGTN